MYFRSQDLKFLVDQHGQSVTLAQKTLGTYDPATGGVTGGSSTSYNVKCYFYNYNLQDIDGVNVVLGDRRAVIGLTDVFGTPINDPEVGDEISAEGDTVSVVSVSKIMSGSSPVCFLLQVRE